MARIQVITSRRRRVRPRRVALIFALIVLVPIAAAAQDDAARAGEPRYSVSMSGGYGFPLSKDGVDVFAAGVPFDVAVGIAPAWRVPFTLRLSVPANILYVEDPVDTDAGADSDELPYPAPATIGLGVGARYEFPLNDRLSLYADVAGGPFLTASGTAEFGGWLGGGAGVTFDVWPSLALEAGATYREYFGLYRDVAAVAGVTYRVPAGRGRTPGETVEPAAAGGDPLAAREPARPVSYSLGGGYQMALSHVTPELATPGPSFDFQMGVETAAGFPLEWIVESGSTFGSEVEIEEDGDGPQPQWVWLGAGARVGVPFFRSLAGFASLSGGPVAAWVSNDYADYGWHPWVGAELGLRFRPWPAVSFSLAGRYREAFGLSRTAAVTLSTAYHFARSERYLQAREAEGVDTGFAVQPMAAPRAEDDYRRPLTVGLTGDATLPFNRTGDEFFRMSGGDALTIGFAPFRRLPLELGLTQQWTGQWMQQGASLQMGGWGLDAVIVYPLLDDLAITGGGAGGIYGAWLTDSGSFGWSGWASGRVGARYYLSSKISLVADLKYRELFGLYRDLALGVGTAFHMGRSPALRGEPRRAPVTETRPQLLEQREPTEPSGPWAVGTQGGYAPAFNMGGDDLYTDGYVVGLDLGYAPFERLPLSLDLVASHTWGGLEDGAADIDPDTFTDATHFTQLPLGLQATVALPVAGDLSAHGSVAAGTSYTDIGSDAWWGGWASAGVGLGYQIVPHLSLALGVEYREFFGMSRDLAVTLGTAYHFDLSGISIDWERREREPRVRPQTVETPPEDEAEVAEASEPEDEQTAVEGEALETAFGTIRLAMTSVFPVYYSYYDSHPVGTVAVTNTSRDPVENLTVSFYVGQYMDNAKESDAIAQIGRDETARVDVYALFTSQILEITEGAKVSALFTLDYTLGGKEMSEEFIETIEVNNRNAMTWDDDRKICAFVTAKDPAVMRFARNTTGYIQDARNRGVSSNLMSAMGLHEALDVYGMHYIPDPTTPYTELSEQTQTIDYLLFPRQTLEYQGGDCDDLSALYCALLESLGVETAFITIPGHIYMAFSLGMSEDDARAAYNQPDNLIFRDGQAWIPVEITLRDQGFLTAWQRGAKQWRENHAAGLADFYPVRDGWNTYQPVGLPGSATLAAMDSDEVEREFASELMDFIDREIASQVATIQARIDDSPRNPRWYNKLGILYARYGVDDRAIGYFEQALARRDDYAPALVNLGNIHYLSGDIFSALDYYEEAQAIAPDHPDVLLNIARANHEIENYGTARRAYAKLQDVSPSLANRFAYLDLRGEEAARAAQAGDVEGVILWSEEDEE